MVTSESKYHPYLSLMDSLKYEYNNVPKDYLSIIYNKIENDLKYYVYYSNPDFEDNNNYNERIVGKSEMNSLLQNGWNVNDNILYNSSDCTFFHLTLNEFKKSMQNVEYVFNLYNCFNSKYKFSEIFGISNLSSR
jgi:hypothetical protein